MLQLPANQAVSLLEARRRNIALGHRTHARLTATRAERCTLKRT